MQCNYQIQRVRTLFVVLAGFTLLARLAAAFLDVNLIVESVSVPSQ
jgi:hypothetical protein